MIVNFTASIVCDDEGVNPLHLCEEIQAYLNSNHNESYIETKVISYKLEVDKQVPFFYQEEY
tara:strand:+ start:1107 stop:1292 length:186 start_codon:yes stop_codon:yes gene_type:complete